MQGLKLTLESNPESEDLEVISTGLEQFNEKRVGRDNFESLTVFLRNKQGAVVGGCVAETYWEWLYIAIIVVPEQWRGQGYGEAILTRAEQVAKQRGCKHAYLDTFSFQSPQFYLNRGYVVFGELPNFPAGNSRYFLQKSL